MDEKQEIQSLRRELEQIEKQRELRRQSREKGGVPVVALVGYTNAGKSSLLNRLCDAAVSLCDQDIQELSWTSFVASCTEPELIQYLKERRLYVNDPVESEVEL